MAGDTFLSAMQSKWAEYGNVYSPKLQIVWAQIQATLDNQSGPDALDVWPVIPAELGIGKTTAAKLWCARTDRSALVVVRTREQAREFAADVNAWSGDGRTVALFSPSDELPNDYWLSPGKTRQFQVVVVCHKSYETGLDEYALDASHARFETVHQYEEGKRDIVIIDEALDQVAESRISRGSMREVMAVVQDVVRMRRHDRHLEAQRVLDSADRALREAPVDRHQSLSASELLALSGGLTVEQATAHLDALWKDIKTSPRVKPDTRKFAIGVLDVLRRHLNTRPWTNTRWASSARLLRTPEGTHGVILDATGQLNNVYAGRPGEFELRHVAPVRDYQDVTVFEAQAPNTGKLRLLARAEAVAKECARDLVAHYGGQVRERRLLIVMAKDTSKTQQAVTAFKRAFADAGFAEVAITNWGRVDGRNDWKDYDTLLLASLHYGSNTQDVNAYLAISDQAPDDDTLNAVDEVKVIRQRRVAAAIAQAIGRLRLRTMTSPDGRCAPCDVWVRLPNVNIVIDVQTVMGAVAAVLPGVVRKPWATASRRAPRPGRGQAERRAMVARVTAYLGGLPGDQNVVTANTVRAVAGVSTSSWGRFLQSTKALDGWRVVRPAVSGWGRETIFKRELLPPSGGAPTAL